MNNHNVILYSTPTCPYCVHARKFFDEHKIEYKYVDVSLDRASAMEMVQKSGQMGVPVIDIDGQITVGFQPAVFTKQLGL